MDRLLLAARAMWRSRATSKQRRREERDKRSSWPLRRRRGNDRQMSRLRDQDLTRFTLDLLWPVRWIEMVGGEAGSLVVIHLSFVAGFLGVFWWLWRSVRVLVVVAQLLAPPISIRKAPSIAACTCSLRLLHLPTERPGLRPAGGVSGSHGVPDRFFRGPGPGSPVLFSLGRL